MRAAGGGLQDVSLCVRVCATYNLKEVLFFAPTSCCCGKLFSFSTPDLITYALICWTSCRLLICGLISLNRSAEPPPEASKSSSKPMGRLCYHSFFYRIF